MRSNVLRDKDVIRAMLQVDRKEFTPQGSEQHAYADYPLPIGHGQTISAPHMVAIMTQHLKVLPGNKVLEVGAGSGYQAAILSRLVGEKGRVITIERIPELARMARKRLSVYENVKVVVGNGALGFEEEAPFDRILVTCAAQKVPEALKKQLNEGGRMVIPVGSCFSARLLLLIKKQGRLLKEDLHCPCSFVPLVE
ncbi:MAG: protein-L-isoaspartate O-methyltransferase [Thermoplasmata archaeon]|nr:MAG: protein-L-isoaspartate O-methyltransferase [Thermoplasmata archaeon]